MNTHELPGFALSHTVYQGSETLVRRGRQMNDDSPVAVKMTHNENPTPRELGRLRREFDILNHVGHLPGVAKARALLPHGNGLALVLDDLGDTSLQHVLEAGRLDIATTLDIAISIADTLGSLHRLGVIHKDLKPRNVMVSPGPSAPRIIDFGISARISQEVQTALSATALEGTVAYMSPEQTGRINRMLDRRSDLYSLGVMLYEMLTGSLPFPGSDPAEVIHGHLTRVPTPPYLRAPSVPRGLSDIVMKLLAKLPEDRYQTADGLRRDLEVCAAQWAEAAQIEPFPLGRKDISDDLVIPQALYGRKPEVESLLATFGHAQRGDGQLVLISGYSGVGKSALVGELQKPIAQRGGFFASGKFDQVNRSEPLAPVAHAFRDLVRQILATPEAARVSWKAKLLEAVGPNGRLLFDLIPELEIVLGPQPEVQALPPTESRNRFSVLIQRFLRVFAAKAHPLVLFLDDLQWADPASLEMLGVLLGDPESKHLLIVGAYRDNEVDEAHPLVATLAEIRKTTKVVTLSLAPLDLRSTTELCADALRTRPADVAPLAAVIAEKTQGNPFFVIQFLRYLHEERLISFDAQAGRFTWDVDRVREAKVTDNVVELMLGKLSRLAEHTRRALELASCIGHSFDLGTLATIANAKPSKVAADLRDALTEGLVIPLDGDYRLVDASESFASAAEGQKVSYRFLHDRVREASYARIREETKQSLHLTIGRLLWERSGKDPHDEDLFEIVRHLNQGEAKIDDSQERADIAALDLRAGRRAKAATAYAAAFAHFEAGVSLLGKSGWEDHYDLCFALHVEGAESAYLSGKDELAEARFDALLPRAKTNLEKASILRLRVGLAATRGKFSDAVKAGLDALALLGITFPEKLEEQQAAFGAGLVKVAESLAGRNVDDLVDLPDMKDPAHRLSLQLLADLTVPIYFVATALWAPIVFKMVEISLEHGNSDVSGFAYMTYGFLNAVFLGQVDTGYSFGRLALAVDERQKGVAYTCKINVLFQGMVYLREPARRTNFYAQRVWQIGLETGDFVSVSSISFSATINKLFFGCELSEVRDDADKGVALTRRTKDQVALGVLNVVKRVLANLRGQTTSRSSLSGDSFDEVAFRKNLNEKDESNVVGYFHLLRMFVRYLHGDYVGAAEDLVETEKASAVMVGNFAASQISPYAVLTLLRLPPEADPEKAAARAASIASHKAKITGLATICPTNYQQWLLLIEAEEARAAGKYEAAIDLCDKAIELTDTSEVLPTAMIANELAANMWVALGKPKLARPYMTDAYTGYRRWGATAKAEDLARDYAELLPRHDGLRRSTSSSSSSSSSSGLTTHGTTLFGTTIGSIREAALVVRAAQAIASEIALPKVIERLMKVVLENVGATRGALVLSRGDRLTIESQFEVSPEKIEVGLARSLDSADDMAVSVILAVTRTLDSVIVDDTHADGRFPTDPYVIARRARSILCLPLLHQGRLVGLLYLEHALMPAAFVSARVELVELFAAQAAVAIENALLIADVQQANDDVRRTNERLEAEVAARTDELRKKNQALGDANARLSLELEEREKTERERASLQEQMITAQRERLLEMSTPLIPITDRIVVLPLIGTVDAERAQQVLEVALDGATRYQASVVILDITGMKHVDTQVVGSLMNTAAALRLLGAHAVLTGIRPEVAHTMVELGVDLTGLVTKSTLKSGIAYALDHSGAEEGSLAGKSRSTSRRR